MNIQRRWIFQSWIVCFCCDLIFVTRRIYVSVLILYFFYRIMHHVEMVSKLCFGYLSIMFCTALSALINPLLNRIRLITNNEQFFPFGDDKNNHYYPLISIKTFCIRSINAKNINVLLAHRPVKTWKNRLSLELVNGDAIAIHHTLLIIYYYLSLFLPNN